MTIQELLAKPLKPDETYAVDRVTAVVVKASEHRTGKSGKGAWSNQLLQLRDPNGTDVLQAIVWNHSDLSGLVGKAVDISADSEMRGLYLENREGKVRLAVQGRATIVESPSVSPTPAATRSITLERAAEVMEFFHNIAKGIYEDPQAAASVGNTLFIAWVKGQIGEEGA